MIKSQFPLLANKPPFAALLSPSPLGPFLCRGEGEESLEFVQKSRRWELDTCEGTERLRDREFGL